MDSFEKHRKDGLIVPGEASHEATPQEEASNLLEYYRNTVTNPVNEHGARYELAKCHCRCSFCPDCCIREGFKLRGRLIPILETFNGLIMASLTIDPELFPDPRTAYLYVMDNRCVSVTTQDLYRWDHLYTKRYIYVIEWQKNTEFVHFHILYDSSFIPWEELLRSWSKHRPENAGAVVGNRPAFGTALISKKDFGGAVHAARYATKYLIKAPEQGFPQWVLNMGDERRIRRFSTSRGFWNETYGRSDNPQTTRKNQNKTYAEKIKSCGDSINVFEIKSALNKETGEIITAKKWQANFGIKASDVMENLFDPGDERRSRRSLLASNMQEVKRIIEATSKTKIETLRFRHNEKEIQNE